MTKLLDSVTYLRSENFSYKHEFDKYPDWLVNLYDFNRVRGYSNGVVSYVLILGLAEESFDKAQLKRLRYYIGSDSSHFHYAESTKSILLPGDKLQLWDNGTIETKKFTREKPTWSNSWLN